mmetsp:Transcript_28207/g.57211  ORF Transcript_28207/g.57211 Transcript_28207/m.57211 type:complete len:236 (+) Transcript_28207:614-1321(+)
MLADQAACVSAVRSCLRAEAWRMRSELERQLVLRRDGVSHDVGDGHFCRRDQIEVPILMPGRKQIFLKLGQLARSSQTLLVDDIRHIDLLISVLLRVCIEHILHECTMQARNRPLEQHKPCAGDLGRHCKVHSVESCSDVHVVLYLEVKHRHLPPPRHLHVIFLARPLRNVAVRRVRYTEQHVGELVLERLHLPLCLLHLCLQSIHLLEHRRDVFALGLEHPDALGLLVPLLLQR